MIGEPLEKYANSLGHGFIKPWKANGMTLDFKWIRKHDDRDRSLKWVRNCLEMEGFWTSDCEKINDWLWENVK